MCLVGVHASYINLLVLCVLYGSDELDDARDGERLVSFFRVQAKTDLSRGMTDPAKSVICGIFLYTIKVYIHRIMAFSRQISSRSAELTALKVLVGRTSKFRSIFVTSEVIPGS
jgi:hypothetical protein